MPTADAWTPSLAGVGGDQNAPVAHGHAQAPAFRFGSTVVLPAQRQLWVDGRRASIGERAFDVLLVLIGQRGRPVSKDELLDAIWPDQAVEDGNLHVHVSALRRLLGADAIATVRGRGYQFTAVMKARVDGAAAPAPQTTLVGRTALMATWAPLLRQQRLLTLVGPGGVGKTALAHALASAGSSGEPIVWVDLAAIERPDHVPAALAQALRVPGAAAPAELADALHAQRALVVLDNAEHVLAAASELVTELLARAPQLRLLVTTRERLGHPQETLLAVPCLELPASTQSHDAMDAGAVALFAVRASAADPHFALTPANLRAVAEICQRLDGLPLALELAAARVPLLGLQGLLDSLDERLHVLRAGTVPRRAAHHSLQDLLGWSYGLLGNDEQATLRALSVMAGSFSLDTAAEVAQVPGQARGQFIERFDALLRKSLIQPDAAEPLRWRLLQTTRLFALDALKRHGEEEHRRRLHAQALARQIEAQDDNWLCSARTEADIDHAIELDLDNLCAALDWACAQPGDADRSLAARLLSALWRPLFGLGLRARARGWVDATAPLLAAEAPLALQARLNLLSTALPPTGRQGAALQQAAAERAAASFDTLSDRQRRSFASGRAAMWAARQGDAAAALAWLQAAAEALHPDDIPRVRAWPVYLQALLYVWHTIGAAPRPEVVQELLDDLAAAGDLQCRQAYTLRILFAEILLREGCHLEARDALRSIRDDALASPHDHIRLSCCPHDTVALAEIACGDLAAAAASIHASLADSERADLWVEVTVPLAWYLAARGRCRSAMELMAGTDAWLAARAEHLDQLHAWARREAMALLRRACTEDDIGRWRSQGAAWGPDGLKRRLAARDPRYVP